MVLLLTAPPAAARPGTGGSYSAEFLRLGTGAYGAAMGDAMTAAATGVQAPHYNPAGLAWTVRNEAAASYQNLVLDINYGDLVFVHPFRTAGAMSAEVKFIDYGTIERNTLTTAGLFVSGQRVGDFGAHDLAASLGYGRAFGNLAVGANIKLVTSKLDDASATVLAGDFGLQWAFEDYPVTVGATLKNFGTKMQFDVKKESLPLLGRAGASFRLFDDKMLVNLEVEKASKEQAAILMGVEYRVVRFLDLRAGFDDRNEIQNGWTAGLGAHFGDLDFDYAFIPYGVLGNNHRVGLRYRFGPIRTRRP
ncbi:MAG: hypothetical protein D6679_11635 [Candidatus Hydrogenedentota bacterium]|nr:MAG: hypothetical protein D6679_11635 [Candidatus Hydrogenedentota bacterium]